MSKSLGNFFTLRDLVLKGHKPSSIRFLLSSVPYRKQLNFTFDGLKQAANSVERLRNFKRRLESERFPAGASQQMAELARNTMEEMRAGLEDDLNTAQALGAMFDMVREANAAADGAKVRQDDVAPLLDAVRKFGEIFPVLDDDDAPKIQRTLEWAKAAGKEASAETIEAAKAAALGDAEIERLIGEMQAARKARNFAQADAIRAQLNDEGIVVEITKDGARWKRK
jgi:cysteinyl-tRNA synthetase